MKNKKIIEEVLDEILKEKIDYLSLKNKLERFYQLLIKLTGLDIDRQINRQAIQFDNGIALSPTFAAMCINDSIRTRQFIRGIYKAVSQVSSRQSTPINIFYAGTGPFATLILPLLTKFSPNQLQLTLLEVNKKTVSYLTKLIKQLEIEQYVKEIICADASKFKIGEEAKVDILISETMQYGLVKEQQVPIMINLVSQLDENVIIIPNKIKLDLALMNSNTKLLLEGKNHLIYKNLKSLLNFDKEFITSHIKKKPYPNQNQRFELCNRIPFRYGNDYDKLVVLTSIQVYEKEWLNVDTCSLTIPKKLFDLEKIAKHKKEILLSYVVSSNPDFEYELY